ncbi:hypothetical protein [Moorena sp. SIO3I6]|uniref:hypothetical protein n=1 Tax=Moorena sp. SIO3I6 TaxID=2607831 RepID=UPI0013FA16F9|nr:hypothetical protein [Moorena sp. SIO3I6]NEP24945.1 hypothetical protein [Moorena sp. SIO3I6]
MVIVISHYYLLITDYLLPITYYRLLITDYRLDLAANVVSLYCLRKLFWPEPKFPCPKLPTTTAKFITD